MADLSTSLYKPDNIKTAQDWVRLLRFSKGVNKQTVGVDTDRVTPDLLLASSNKLLGISKGLQLGDAKDALQFQRVYGPVEYFALRIQRDGGSVARSMLWKATTKGNLDFIGSGSLHPHISAVFNLSNLSQFIDNSTPLDGIDNSLKVTRIGEGGVQDDDSVPIEMRLVQPSYYGFIDPIRCYSEDTLIYTKKGWISVKDMTDQDEFACLIDGKPEWHKPESITSYDYEGVMYGYEDKNMSYLVTPLHRMYVSDKEDVQSFDIQYVLKSSWKLLNFLTIDYKVLSTSKDNYYTKAYKGRVYCPTVPGGLVYVKRNNASFGIWCGNTQDKSPGVTGYMTKNVMKGTDGKLYQKFFNAHTGKEEYVDSQKAARSVVTTNLYLDTKDKYVYAMGGPRGVRIVERSKVDYILPRNDDAYSTCANLVPMLSGNKGLRLNMGCLHPLTPVLIITKEGYTDIVPAKRLISMKDIYTFGCDKNGNDKIYPVTNVITRVPDKKQGFYMVQLLSGRYLPTSPEHKWYIYNKHFQQIRAKDLKLGMLVPRTLFQSMPVRQTEIAGKKVTKQICVLFGRIIRSLKISQYSHKISYIKQQLQDILLALKQLDVKKYSKSKLKGICYISIKDPVFIDWLDQNIGTSKETFRIPSALLSLPLGYTAVFLDSYYKDLRSVCLDFNLDIWLVHLPNDFLRDGISFMLSKIYTDTKFRDSTGNSGKALQLGEYNKDNIVLLKIVSIHQIKAPAVMIDIDCDDNVYAAGNGIITHNSKYGTQAVPLEGREAPLVRAIDEATGLDMPTKLGKLLGTQWAAKSGMVKAVRDDRIDMLYDDGTTGSVPLYKDFPANAKGWLSNYPKVKAGDHVDKGALLASSNYTDDKGVLAMGCNLRIGYMSYHGGTYEDACTLSLSAAKRMGYTTMYKTDMDKDKSIRTAKTLYKTWKPGQYTKLQLLNLDDDGVVKVGATVNKGDPMILGIQTTEPSPGTLGKRLLSDVTEVWLHAHPGIVTDVVNTKNGIKVFAKVSSPLKPGDKISALHGNKATVAQVIPDEQMPKDEKDRPLEILFDPLGIISRCYDKETLFLTKEGWKLGKDIRDDLLLYSFDSEKNTCHWSKQIEPMYKKHYAGPMYGVNSLLVDFKVTPHHKFCRWINNSFEQVEVEDIYNTSCVLPVKGTLNSTYLLNEPLLKTVESISWYTVDYDDMVYCPTVDTGYVVTRRNGKVIIAHNTNSSQMMLAALGKVAAKLGHPITMQQFMPKGQSRLKYVKQLLKDNHISPTETIYDPSSNRHIKNVFTGVLYFLPLKHIGDTKMSARGTESYTALGVPASGGVEGSKRIGGLELAALVGHNAFDFITTDAKLIRGQANADFWRSIRTGQIPVIPGLPLVHKKFFATLQASGVNVKRDQLGVSIFALSNKDVDEMAKNRLVNSASTYLQKSFRPIDGGLFGLDIFGSLGNKWGYIQLDKPLPNPVMLEPLARLLRLSDSLFQDVVAGKRLVNGLTGPEAIKQALLKVDLLKLADVALRELKEASPSRRDAALKRYVAIGKMRDNGVQPSEYMLDRIPVLPPVYRPITSHGGLTMVADPNYLYAQLINARDDAREALKLPKEYRQEAQANVYSKWKLLVGLYLPSDVKLRNKDVKGLLKWALGKSPKWSSFAQKVLGATVDTVGRGVVIPSTKIKLNLIGMPILMAWDVYAPFVTRKLVQANYSPVEAMKLVKAHSPLAKQALVDAVSERPAVLNRAPSLHKLSLMGFNVKLTDGYAIKTNPSICPVLAMDYDGNCVDFDSEITLEISESLLHFFKGCCSLSYEDQKTNNGGFMRVDSNTKVNVESNIAGKVYYTTMKIGEVPRIGTPVKDRNGADMYKMPEGLKVAAIDPVTGKRGFYPVESITVEEGSHTVKVVASSHSVIISDNESMAVFDQTTGGLTKIKPVDLKGKLVPIMKKNPAPFGTFGNRDLGWLLGGIISDGWTSANILGYSKLEDIKRTEVERILRSINPNFIIHEYEDKGQNNEKKLGNSKKIHIYSPEIADWIRSMEILDKDADYSKKTACCKQISSRIIDFGSEEMLWGLLSGLIDGDGSMVINRAKEKPRFYCNYATSSPSLRDSFCALLYRLGLRYSVTTQPPRNWSNEAYTICISSIDLYANIDKLTCIGERETSVIKQWKEYAPVYEDKNDQVPVSDEEWKILRTVCNQKTDAGTYSACMKKGKTRSSMRACLLRYSDFIKQAIPTLYARLQETNTIWSSAEVVEDTGDRQVFDLMVKDAKVFGVNSGFVVWDTVNLHVPVSQAAIRNVRLNMMPERNLISMRKNKILYKPLKSYIQGLYIATRMGLTKDVKTFNTVKEAQEAYHRGDIDIDTPIVIKDSK